MKTIKSKLAPIAKVKWPTKIAKITSSTTKKPAEGKKVASKSTTPKKVQNIENIWSFKSPLLKWLKKSK